jgi:predicted 3-demethylubiquinone-9 3-methyltransferase (glyoxalase superfamily)
MKLKQRIIPFLSYQNQAAEAADFYVSVVPDSKIIRKVKNPANDSLLTVEFELCGMKFVSLNAGRDWQFTEAMSLAIECDTQEELDSLWTKLLADGGSELACGWLKDKYGMCWQVWPSQMTTWLASNDAQALQRMFESCWKMGKLDIAVLQKAFEGQ